MTNNKSNSNSIPIDDNTNKNTKNTHIIETNFKNVTKKTVHDIYKRQITNVQRRRISFLTASEKFQNRFNLKHKFTKIFHKHSRGISDLQINYRSFIISFIIFALTLASIIYLANSNSSTSSIAYKITNICILSSVSLLFLLLDYVNKFHEFQRKFEIACNSYGQGIFLISFCILAFIDYILIGLEDDDVISGESTTAIIDTLYYISILLFLCTIMAYWKTISFYCSEKSWIHAFLYLTILGYIIVAICRWLRPVYNPFKDKNMESQSQLQPKSPHPKSGKSEESNSDSEDDENNAPPVLIGITEEAEKVDSDEYDRNSWHRYHPIENILSAIISVLLLMFVFFIMLGGIGIAAFAEFAKISATLGVLVAIALFCALSMVIMLTPLAPGSIVDACGGFVFVQLLVKYEDYSFFSAWGIAMIAIINLHFLGACAQWWVGTWPCVQIWANSTLPTEMLAASDAVLRHANWFKVGLVGFIFMDTANGLNQGRINMAFWTQLFSEWTSVPNAFGLVSLGATIAAQALDLQNMQWTVIAVPLFILFSTLVQMFGTTFGARAMGNSTDTADYWKSREKWTMMQFFKHDGYSPSKLGWSKDLFDLCDIYDLVAPAHNEYITERDKCSDPEQRLAIFENYRKKLVVIRAEHYEKFSAKKEEYTKREWLIYEPIVHMYTGFFQIGENEDKLPAWKIKLWGILCIIGTFAFWASFAGIYLQSSLTDAVQNGFSTLDNVKYWAWIGSVIFIMDICFVYHIEIYNSLKTTISGMTWVVFGCTINPETETKFETPEWPLIEEEKEIEVEKEIEDEHQAIHVPVSTS